MTAYDSGTCPHGYLPTTPWALNFRTFGGDFSGQKHFAMFRVTMEDIEKLKDGVEKIAINTIPKVYALSNWMEKKSFGKYLYNDFMNLKDEIED